MRFACAHFSDLTASLKVELGKGKAEPDASYALRHAVVVAATERLRAGVESRSTDATIRLR